MDTGTFERSLLALQRQSVKGKNGHDARIVASMNLHGVAAIPTFNVPDFTRFSGITVLDPRELFNEAPRNETRTDS